jgi:hypothetical protein
VLRTVKLPRTERCAKHRPETTSREIRSIVRGNLSHRGSFTITGERITGEYVKGSFHLRIEVAPEEALGFGSIFATEEGGSGRPSSPFKRQLKTGCQPQEYAIVYGVLKNRADTVLVRSAGVLEALHRARIPARLHLGPVLAYIALPAVPSELLVRTPSGKIVTRENLSRRARDARETCEGEAEG